MFVQRCNHIFILQNVPAFNHFLEKKRENGIFDVEQLRHDVILMCACDITYAVTFRNWVVVIGCVEFYFSEFLGRWQYKSAPCHFI